MSKFPGSIMYGDFDEDDFVYGDVTIGDVEIGDIDPSDTEGESIGDIASKIKAKLRRKSAVRINVAPDASGPAASVASVAAKAAGETYFGTPGAALESLTTIPLWAVNAKIATPGTTRKISGNTLKSSIESMLKMCTWASLYQSQAPAGGIATMTFDGSADAVHRHKPVPILFITIAASTMVARAGGRLQLNFTYQNPMGVYGGGDGQGIAFSSDTWIIERTNVTKPIQLVYFPYVRVKDIITPNPATVGMNLLDTTATTMDLTITVGGLADEEVVQAVLPGLDSTDLHQFMKAFKVKL